MPALAETSGQKKTVADFMALGEGPPFAELINGEIIMAPSPFRNHQSAVQRIYQSLQNHLDSHPVGECYLAPFDVHFDDSNVLCPDLSFFSNERLHVLSERGAEGAPDLVVEVLSPSTARRDRKEKREIYTQFGVRELWLVNTDLETIEVFDLVKQADQPIAVLENGTHPSITTPILPEFTLVLADVFRV